MKIECKNLRAVPLLLACLGLQAWTPTLNAASPAGCQGCGVAVAPLTAATVVKSGTVVLFDVSVANAIPQACDIVNSTVTFYCPKADGTPDLANPVVLVNGTLNLPFGATATVATGIPCTITTNAGVTTAQAFATVTGPAGSCLKGPNDVASGTGTTSLQVTHPCFQVTKICPPNNACTPYGQPIQFSGTVINCGDEDIDVTLTDSPAATILPSATFTLLAGATVNYTGSYTPTANLCGPLADTITLSGVSVLTGTVLTPVTATASCPVCNVPCVSVTKNCADLTTQNIGAGKPYTISGQVNNCGNVPLINVVVTDHVVFTPTTGAPFTQDLPVTLSSPTLGLGGVQTFTATVNVPPDFCGTITDQFRVTAASICPTAVAPPAESAICSTTIVSNPGITVTKVCGPASIVLGQSYTVSGSIQNTGDRPLSNIVVTDTVTDANNVSTTTTIATIAGPVAVGASATFGPSAPIVPILCGPSVDRISVTATDSCGQTATAQSNICTTQVTSTPGITVTKICGPATIQLGGSYTVSGSVRNTGDTALSNIVVTDTITDASNNSTTVTIATIPGPLAPNATATFGPSAAITPVLCGPSRDRLSVTAVDACQKTATAQSDICTTQVGSNPGLTVTKVCGPASIVLGTSYTVSGSVQNTGDSALSNIVVTDTITDANNVSTTVTIATIAGPLAPNASATFGPSAAITPILCGPSTDRLSATAVDACQQTVNAQSNLCTTQVTSTPGITVTKVCGPASIVLGASYTVSGSVRNTGDTALSNIVVTDTVTDANNVTTTTTIATIAGPLAPNATATFGPSAPITPILCGPSTDRLSVTAVDACQKTTTAQSAICTTQVTSTPGITVTKICGPAVINLGASYTVSGSVQNTGDTPLHNIVVTDTMTDAQNQTTTRTITTIAGPLAPGASATFGPSAAITPTLCGPSRDQFSVTALDACNKPTSASSQTCTTDVQCPPHITLTKQVVCAPASGICDGSLTYAKTASGVKAGNQCPNFCYKIVITNDGQDDVQNVVLNDPELSNFAPPLPTTLAIGASATTYASKSWCADHVNTARVTAVGVKSGTTVNAQDTASVVVREIAVACEITLTASFDLDKDPADNHVTLPSDSAPGTPVQVGLTLRNNGTADLIVTSVSGLDSLVNCDTGLPINLASILGLPLSVSKQQGSVTIPLIGCWNVTCPGGSLSVTVTAIADSHNGTLCVYDQSGNVVSQTGAPCTATVICEVPASCRVTGGGVLLPGELEDNTCSPDIMTKVQGPNCNNEDAVKVTHGGQLGAPYSRLTCGNVALYPMGDPCIRGQWEHVRHYKGKSNPKSSFEVDNFHSNTPKGIFDSLQCACLPCCENPNAGGKQGNLCNPDDHKICGPMPRPAPANAIIFSGVGYINSCASANKKGGRSDAVVFRVYIEDRSEPGGQHPGGGKKPGDVYCFQAWSLAAITGNANGKITDAAAIAARQALADDNCAFIKGYRQGQLPNANLLGTPLVNDCGALHTGNQQIHPSTSATCTTPVL